MDIDNKTKQTENARKNAMILDLGEECCTWDTNGYSDDITDRIDGKLQDITVTKINYTPRSDHAAT